MSLTGIALIIIAIAFLILVLALLPAIAAVKKTSISVASLSDMMQSELKPVIQELNSLQQELKPLVKETSVLVADMRTVGSGIAEHTDDVTRFMSALGETGNNLSTINNSVGMVAGLLNNTTAYITGAKVAGKYILDRYFKKRGGF